MIKLQARTCIFSSILPDVEESEIDFGPALRTASE